MSEQEDIPLVAAVLDEKNVVISWGNDRGVSHGQRVLIFRFGPTVKHPSTGKSLGQLEIVKGYGRVVNVQAKMSIVASDGSNILGQEGFKAEPYSTYTANALAVALPGMATNSMTVQIGDFVKLV